MEPAATGSNGNMVRPVPKSGRRFCPPSGPAMQMAPYKQGPDARLSAVAAVLPGPGPPLEAGRVTWAAS
ncbi:hypothetical protein [Azospirillum largimobile]